MALCGVAVMAVLIGALVALARSAPSQPPPEGAGEFPQGQHAAVDPLFEDRPTRVALHAIGRAEEAYQQTAALLSGLGEGDPLPLMIVNDAVNFGVTAGRYSEAVRWANEAGEVAPALDEVALLQQWSLIRINQADALCNLGKWEEAVALLDRIPASEKPTLALPMAGLRVQRAWILAHGGEPSLALEVLARVEASALPPTYRSELFFCAAAALIGLKQIDEAREQIRHGLALAMRASSRRNATFLLGRCAFAQGDLVAAEQLLRRGAEAPFQGQGGDGLLLWGDCLHQLGRTGEALEAWGLAVERDPQSESAALARERLSRERFAGVTRTA